MIKKILSIIIEIICIIFLIVVYANVIPKTGWTLGIIASIITLILVSILGWYLYRLAHKK